MGNNEKTALQTLVTFSRSETTSGDVSGSAPGTFEVADPVYHGSTLLGNAEALVGFPSSLLSGSYSKSIVPASQRRTLGVKSENELYMEVRAGIATCWLNGNVLFSGIEMPTISAGLIGLMSEYRHLTELQTNNADYGIRQIKAWIDGIPEPSNSHSGHGDWDSDEGFVYTDKYHADDVYRPDA